MARFGRVEWDPASRRLWVDGRPPALDRASLGIFALLAEQAGSDVHKDRLLEAGWPGRVVHENSLAKAIGRLRHAMGEDGGRLETVHGHGYRLSVETPTPAPLPERPARARPLQFAAAAAIALLAVAVPASLLWSGEDRRQLIRGEPADIHGRLLWVDDHPDNNQAEKRYFERRKIAVYQVRTSEEALALLAMYQYRVVISDMNRDGKPLDGLTLVREMRRRSDRTPFYLYTYVPSQAQRTILAQAGGQDAAVEAKELYAKILPLFEKGQQAAR